jgi:hypothetical protein
VKVELDCQVPPPSILYAYVPEPPETPVNIIEPFAAPKHVTLVTLEVALTGAEGCVIVAVPVPKFVHTASDTAVMVYVFVDVALTGKLKEFVLIPLIVKKLVPSE